MAQNLTPQQLEQARIRNVILMRPPKTFKISVEDYTQRHWPQIAQSLSYILNEPSKAYSSYSQEELFRSVYNVCCQRHTVQCYNDLLNLVTEWLNSVCKVFMELADDQLLNYFNQVSSQYKTAIGIICTVFRYLDRIYVTEKLNLSLNTVLQNHFHTVVLSRPDIREKLAVMFSNIPSFTDPSAVMNVVKTLYAHDTGLAALNPKLFALYIPTLEKAKGIEIETQLTLEYIAFLRSQGFSEQTSKFKRTYQDFLAS
eukprot:TRINITY_DN6528_c0_g1_i1.p1 TRINITY_DN6528_c0_g1~~TRINITY_DN6528_c0_g1_i1.p1  ORF type:complete len:256 (+),score=29.24 TRINITY_DN6528_c0_g1_i1:311-1078(+)